MTYLCIASNAEEWLNSVDAKEHRTALAKSRNWMLKRRLMLMRHVLANPQPGGIQNQMYVPTMQHMPIGTSVTQQPQQQS